MCLRLILIIARPVTFNMKQIYIYNKKQNVSKDNGKLNTPKVLIIGHWEFKQIDNFNFWDFWLWETKEIKVSR